MQGVETSKRAETSKCVETSRCATHARCASVHVHQNYDITLPLHLANSCEPESVHGYSPLVVVSWDISHGS